MGPATAPLGRGPTPDTLLKHDLGKTHRELANAQAILSVDKVVGLISNTKASMLVQRHQRHGPTLPLSLARARLRSTRIESSDRWEAGETRERGFVHLAYPLLRVMRLIAIQSKRVYCGPKTTMYDINLPRGPEAMAMCRHITTRRRLLGS